MQEISTAAQQQIEVTTPQLLVELNSNDSRVRFSIEDGLVGIEHPLYLAAATTAHTLRELQDSFQRSSAAIPCKILHAELNFSHDILLEQVSFVMRNEGKRGVENRCISMAIQALYEREHGKYLIVPLQKQLSTDQKLVPMLYKSNSGVHIHCAAYARSICLSFAVFVDSGSVQQPTKSIDDNEEFDKEVARIASKTQDNKEPEESPKKPEARHQRDYDTMPRYYKDSWSPDRGTGAKPLEPEKGEGLLNVCHLTGHESQLSPIGKSGIEEVDEAIGYFQNQFSKIVVRGISCQEIPPASYVVSLLNQKTLLEKTYPGFSFEALDYLTGLALISGRRFLQAAEILRKYEVRLLNPECYRKSGHSLLLAKLEIIIADSMNPHFQSFEKMNSFRRALEAFKGTRLLPVGISAPTKFSREDIFTTLANMNPHLIRLLLSLLNDKAEPIRSATLRSIDFVLENMGCSLGHYVVHLLKVILATYPEGNVSAFPIDSFNASFVSLSSGHLLESPLPSPHKDRSKDDLLGKKTNPEGNSVINLGEGKNTKYIGLYNHLLDTYTSVLSSISSQILHKVFYDIILPNTYPSEITLELRAILLKIAEKILTICQGDLVLNSALLSGVLKDMNSSNDRLATAAQALWHTIRTKVCPNCSPKSKKQIVIWLIQNFVDLAEKMDASTGSKETAEEDAALKLGVYIDITCILTSDHFVEEEASSLVLQPRPEEKSDIYPLINPLMFWLNFTMESENRLELFKQTWQCTHTILLSMNEVLGININSLLIPLMSSVKEHCVHSSPTLSMIQFLQITLGSFKEFGQDIRTFLLELTGLICARIPSYPYEEIFEICDLLMGLVFPEIPEPTFRIIISSFIDRYSIKSKKQKDAYQKLINRILECSSKKQNPNLLLHEPINFFDVTIKMTLIENKDPTSEQVSRLEKRSSKRGEMSHHPRLAQIHDKFIEKLGFLIDLLKSFTEEHRRLFFCLLAYHEKIGEFLSHLQSSGHSSVRLKAYEIMKLLCNYYIFSILKIRNDTQPNDRMRGLLGFENDIIRKEQLILARLLLGVSRQSFESNSDSYMQFNSLILMDLMFQNILPVPTFQNELAKRKQRSPSKISKSEIPDIELGDPRTFPVDLKITDYRYLHLRMLAVLRAWGHIQVALNSPWSNIRSITYGLICSMLKIGIKDYRSSYREKIRSVVLPLLSSLVGSKESESKAGGLNILGSVCGLSYDASKCAKLRENLPFFRRNSDFISLAIWQKVFDLQDDWDSTIREAATVLIQLSAPRESVLHFNRVKSETRKLKLDCLAGKYASFGLGMGNKYLTLANPSSDPANSTNKMLMELLESVGRSSDLYSNDEVYAGTSHIGRSGIEMGSKAIGSESGESSLVESNDEPEEVDNSLFFVEKYSDEQIKDIISIFRNDFKPPENLWIEKNFCESVVDDYYEYEELPKEKVEVQVKAVELPISENAHRRFNMVDNLEDKLVGKLEEKKEKIVEKPEIKKDKLQVKEKIPIQKIPDAPEKKDPKIQEEELNKKDSLDAEPFRFFNTEEEMNQDDLEIIELEDEDFLHTLEGDEVPVLKNSYANKKNKRPTAPKPGSKIVKSQKEPAGKQEQPQPKPSETLSQKVLQDEAKVNNVETKKSAETPTFSEQKQEPEIKIEEKKNDPDIQIKELEEIHLEEDPAAFLRLKKASNTMRPSHGFRPHTPPMKGSAPPTNSMQENFEENPSPPESKPENVEEKVERKILNITTVPKERKSPIIEIGPPDCSKIEEMKTYPHTTKAQQSPILFAGVPEEKKIHKNIKVYQSFAGKKERKSGASRGKINKSFENYHSSRMGSHPTSRVKELPPNSPSDPSSHLDPPAEKRKIVKSTRGKAVKALDEHTVAKVHVHTSSHQSSSLPATPKQKDIDPISDPPHYDVALLVKELELSNKKKNKHKRQCQDNFAKTSPALTAILKSLKQTTTRDSVVRTERTTHQPDSVGQRIVKQAKKIAGVKMISERQYPAAPDEFSHLSLQQKKIVSSIKKRKPQSRTKSKSQMQGVIGITRSHPVQTINITTDQISIKNPEGKRDFTPLRNNYMEDHPVEPPSNLT